MNERKEKESFWIIAENEFSFVQQDDLHK